MHSKSESGRTVLEMIVVIALIMLLIIGGLYGVERAYINVQVKFVTERLITLKNQRMINAAPKQGSNRHTEQGPFGAELTLVNGEGNQDDYFWIIVKKLNAYFCNEMAKADVGAVKVDEQCPDESIFYFSKFSDGTGGGSSMNPDAGNPPSQNCEAGWSATRPSCRANQKLVSESGCYQCQDLATCESPWESYVSCGWGKEETSITLADDETTCYQCVDLTDCPSGWSQADSVSCGVGETKTIKSLANGTQCAQCETLATCSSTYPETISCAANQKEEVAFTANDGKRCKKCTYLTSCSDKSGYSTTPCVRDKVVDQSFTLQGTSTTCYKCKEITACSDQTGYQEGNCQNNQTLVDSFTWNGKTCRKCVNMTTCASPWFSSATCYPGETKEEISLANGTGKCYRCTGTAYTTCAAAGLSSSTCGNGYTQTTRTLKNDTTCYECSCQNSCGTQCCSSRESCQNGTTCVCSANYPVEDAEGNCQACPTSTSRVIVAKSGDCKNVCSGAVETPNGDETYSCCPRNYPRWNGTECVACSGGTPYWDGTQCTVCPNETPHWNGTQCIACSGSTPLWTGTACVACPTNGGSVVLTTSGVCASACNGAETDNGNGTYTCADASMMCYQKMKEAGYDESKFSVSGKNITYTDSAVMQVSKTLDLTGCDLTVTQGGLRVQSSAILKADNVHSTSTVANREGIYISGGISVGNKIYGSGYKGIVAANSASVSISAKELEGVGTSYDGVILAGKVNITEKVKGTGVDTGKGVYLQSNTSFNCYNEGADCSRGSIYRWADIEGAAEGIEPAVRITGSGMTVYTGAITGSFNAGEKQGIAVELIAKKFRVNRTISGTTNGAANSAVVLASPDGIVTGDVLGTNTGSGIGVNLGTGSSSHVEVQGNVEGTSYGAAGVLLTNGKYRIMGYIKGRYYGCVGNNGVSINGAKVCVDSVDGQCLANSCSSLTGIGYGVFTGPTSGSSLSYKQTLSCSSANPNRTNTCYTCPDCTAPHTQECPFTFLSW